jgi:hypothetical protein
MRNVKRSRSLASDQGSILLEASGFATLAFGLLLTLSLQVFELTNRQLGLEQIARNATRSHLLHSGSDLATYVREFQDLDESFANEQVDIYIRCLPADCFASGTLVWLELKSGENAARAYGVIP